MLYVPPWFTKPEWVQSHADLLQAVMVAFARHEAAQKRHNTLKARWRKAKGHAA